MIGSARICACSFLLAGLGGCALQAPKSTAPEVPAAFEQAPAVSANWPSSDWYRGFSSPELDALIAEAVSDNFDLATARARVAQADARARQAHAGILPSVEANGRANYLAGHSSDGSGHETDWSAQLSASYEVDFWGKNHAAADSARYLAAAARADRDTVALTALAGVADGYFTVLSLRERLAAARANLEAATNLLGIVESRFNVGLGTPVEVASQRAALAAAQLAVPELERLEGEALAAVALLLGRAPEGFRVEGATLGTLQEPAVAVGLPAELLQRRPDLARAEQQLASAGADVSVARAALFPSLTLTAAGGIQNPALSAAVLTLSGTGPTLNVGAALLQPLFNGGRLRAARAESEAKLEEAATAYRAAIVGALIDVENSLSAIRHLDAAREAQMAALTQSQAAYEGARLRYQEGYGDFLTALEAERTVFSMRDQFSQYQLARLQALVSLCKALGGGWQGPNSAPQVASVHDAAQQR